MKKINVLLACQNGMSTGILKKKIQEEAIKNDVELNIQAVGLDEVVKEAAKYDLVLLAPQIRYALKGLSRDLNGITKYMMIESIDFGKIDGASVFHKFMKLLE
ncbi:MAG: PTS sugar transporter subunit IIB [Erysipelotrichaceae bacterium]